MFLCNTNLANDWRPDQIKSGTSCRSLLANSSVSAPLQAAAGRHVKLLGLDGRILLSITTVSSTEWLPLITANIISHQESQCALRSSGGDKDARSAAFQERLKAGSWRRHTRRTARLFFAFSLIIQAPSDGLIGTRWKSWNFAAAAMAANVTRRCLSFDAAWENVWRAMMASTDRSLARHRIKGSIFCLSDVLMSRVIWWDTLSGSVGHHRPTLSATAPE